ncbi:ABC transporter permease [Lysinibacillus xylanilyticus]|uniref:ABC transporter permease n=1 Tax=Lysinibacillus xylanilyticus TaxID=582475 RepID=UPI003804048D
MDSTRFQEFKKTVKLTFELSKSDLKTRFVGSVLGITWGFLHPLITILIFWFVFQVGFKSMPVDDFPFILWLMCAMIPWFFFSDSLNGATNSIIENSYLVKKVNFKIGILPLIKIVSSLYIHIFFIAFLFFMFYIYGYSFNIYNLQFLYYLFATIILATGLSYLTASLVVFLKDIGQLVNMLLQFCFWMTPIFWSLDILPEKYLFLIKLNPIYYITDGYRSAFIYNQWFWERPLLTIYFWVVTIFIFIIGYIVYKKLRLHFADVL